MVSAKERDYAMTDAVVTRLCSGVLAIGLATLGSWASFAGDLDMIYDTCQRVLLLSDGVLVADGGRDEILRDRALLEANRLELPLRFS